MIQVLNQSNIAGLAVITKFIHPPKDEQEYNNLVSSLDFLIDYTDGDESHPYAPLVEMVGNFVAEWEEKMEPIPKSNPVEILNFIMEQHGLKQEDIAKTVFKSKGNCSEFFSGKRELSKVMIRRIRDQFHVSADVFL